MKALITGAGGQVGVDLASALIAAGDDVVATDVAPKPGADGRWRTLDVTDAGAVAATIAEEAPEVVFHLAAILSARGERDPQSAYAVNQTGTYNLLEACRLHGVPRLMFTSSIAVYGPGMPEPTPEDVALSPSTVYGATKAAGELLGAYYAHRYGLDFRGIRFPGLISAAVPGGGSSDFALFMYVEAVRSGHYSAFCRADTRIPFMYMPDAVRALMELCRAPKATLTRPIYNIAAVSPTAGDLAASVEAAVPGTHITFDPDPERQAILDSWPRALDDTRARTDWGWQHAFDVEAMTADLVPRIRALVAASGALEFS